MKGCLSVILTLWALLALFYLSQEEPEKPQIYSDVLPKVPPPDSTRVVESFDFSTMEYKYKESKKLEYSRQRKRSKVDNYEKQIIIKGQRYRLLDRADGTILIPIR